MKNKKILVPVIASLVGAAAGYAYYYFIGCKSGACPITGNPFISALYGAFMGFLLFYPKKEKTVEQ